MTIVPTRWAVWGKLPRAGSDYTVIQASDGDADYQALIAHAIPGQVTAITPSRPGGPPWVTVCPHEEWVGLMVGDVTADRDLENRSITRRWYFMVPYAELQAAGAGYTDLYLAGAAVTDPAGTATAGLDVARADPLRVTATLDQEGFAWAAAVAALTLTAPVTINGAEQLPLDQRMALLDAIAALLPYGYRATLSVTSWGNDPHRIRVAFGNGDGTGHRVRYGQLPTTTDLPEPIRRYHDTLIDSHQVLGTADVVRSLLDDPQPADLADHGPTSGAAERLRAVCQQVRSIRGGTATARHIRDLLRTNATSPQPFGTAASEGLGPLLDSPGNDDAALLAPYWCPDVRDGLVERVSQATTRTAALRLLTALDQVAPDVAHLDEVLHGALAELGRAAPVVTALMPAPPSAPRGMPRTRRLLASRPDLLGQLLRADLLSPTAEAARWLYWLWPDRSMSQHLDAVGSTPDSSPWSVIAIVDQAMRSNDPARATAVLATALPSLLRLADDRGEPLETTTRRLGAVRYSTAVTAAWRDLLLLALGASASPPPMDLSPYLAAVNDVLQHPALARRLDDLAEGLITAAFGTRPIRLAKLDNRQTQWIEAVCALDNPALIAATARCVNAAIADASWWSPRDWHRQRKLTRWLAGLPLSLSLDARSRLAIATLQAVAHDAATTPQCLATACVEALATSASAEVGEVAAVLGRWAAKHDPVALYHLYEALAEVLPPQHDRGGLLRRALLADPGYAARFRSWLDGWYAREHLAEMEGHSARLGELLKAQQRGLQELRRLHDAQQREMVQTRQALLELHQFHDALSATATTIEPTGQTP